MAKEGYLLHDAPSKEHNSPGSAWTPSLIASLCGGVLGAFQFGFATSVMNAPETYIQNSLSMSKALFGVAVAIFAITGLLAALSAGRAADSLGRRRFLLINTSFFAAGGLLGAFAQDSLMLIASRAIVGIGCGGATVVVPMYLKEIAPMHLKGAFGTMNQFAIVIGILASVCLGFNLEAHPDTWWRWSLGASCVPAALQVLLYPFMSDSPRWHVLCHRVDAARARLETLRGTTSVDREVASISATAESADAEANGAKPDFGSLPASPDSGNTQVRPEMAAAARASTFDERKPMTLTEMWGNPVLRFALVSAFVLQLAQQLSAINAVFYYSTALFQAMQFHPPLVGTVITCAVNVLATGVAVFLMDRAGRRVLLISGSCMMMTSAAILTIALYLDLSPVVKLVRLFSILVFVTGFEIGLGPIPWLIGAELFSSRERGAAMSACAALNWLANFTVGVVFKPLQTVLGNLVFVPFVIILFLATAFIAKSVPETRGKTPEEVQADIAKRLGISQ